VGLKVSFIVITSAGAEAANMPMPRRSNSPRFLTNFTDHDDRGDVQYGDAIMGNTKIGRIWV
jgi:hypothetical protein